MPLAIMIGVSRTRSSLGLKGLQQQARLARPAIYEGGSFGHIEPELLSRTVHFIVSDAGVKKLNNRALLKGLLDLGELISLNMQNQPDLTDDTLRVVSTSAAPGQHLPALTACLHIANCKHVLTLIKTRQDMFGAAGNSYPAFSYVPFLRSYHGTQVH